LLKKSVRDFFNHAKQKCDFCFASFFKHLRVRKMAVGPSTAPQVVEKRVFQQPANGRARPTGLETPLYGGCFLYGGKGNFRK